MHPRVIFVGAGPVGLMTAIQTKLYYPDLPLLMIEKHAEYKRSHSLFIESSSFKGSHPNEDFQKFISRLPSKIRTNELEDLLLNYARKLGIDIIYKEINDCRALQYEYPSAEIIIGADGSHSKVHEQIFNQEYQLKKTLRYIAEVKYDVLGSTRAMPVLGEGSLALQYAKHPIVEFIGKESEGKTSVAIRIFIDEETYDAMKMATFKAPYHLTDKNKIDSSLYKSMTGWLDARQTMIGEIREENSERISVTNLPVYASKDFVKRDNNITYMLVGDAAFGVPYFRSLNNGFLCSTRLAKTVCALLKQEKIKKESLFSSFKKSKLSNETLLEPTEFYTRYMQKLIKHEDIMASLRDWKVSSLASTAYTVQHLPVNKVKVAIIPGAKEFVRHAKASEEPSSGFFKSSFFSSVQSSEQNDVAIVPKHKGCSIM